MTKLGDALANKIRAERARRRLTQAELAELVGWTRVGIHDAEAGRRKLSPDDLVVFCRTFGITLLQLAHGADPDDLQALGLGD